MEQRKNHIVILVTTGNEIEAKKIARVLVEEKLAGCVNFYPVTSVYRWQNEICEDAEWQLVIKTDEQLFSTLSARIQDLHSYDVPEIIALPIVNSSMAYIQWLQDSLQKV